MSLMIKHWRMIRFGTSIQIFEKNKLELEMTQKADKFWAFRQKK